jgi:endonuclease/exonuclease/phosphatase family metal-dependent hydrolase
MDHVGVIARAESAKLIVRKVEEMCRPDEAVFVCGDFNVDQTNEIYTTFTGSDVLADSYETAADRYAPTGTINGFDPNTLSRSRIDHIFVSPAVKVDNYAVLTETYRGMVTLGGEGTKNANFPQEVSFQANIAKLPSDHFPVFLKVRF